MQSFSVVDFLGVVWCYRRHRIKNKEELQMTALAKNDFQLLQSTLSVNEIRERLVETEKMMDSYLARITRLQLLIQLEEARLLRSQEEYQQLQILLGNPDSFEE
jgi:hypothetical protein